MNETERALKSNFDLNIVGEIGPKAHFRENFKHVGKCIRKKIFWKTHTQPLGKRINFIYPLTIFKSLHK